MPLSASDSMRSVVIIGLGGDEVLTTRGRGDGGRVAARGWRSWNWRKQKRQCRSVLILDLPESSTQAHSVRKLRRGTRGMFPNRPRANVPPWFDRVCLVLRGEGLGGQSCPLNERGGFSR